MLALLRLHSVRRTRRAGRHDIAFEPFATRNELWRALVLLDGRRSLADNLPQIPQKQRALVVRAKRAAPTSGPVEATCCEAMKSLLLLALVVSLGRMLVSCFGLINCLSRLLLCTRVIVTSVLLRGRPMSFRSLLMMLGSLLVHILRHNGFLAILRQSTATPEVPCRINAANGRGAETSVRRRFFWAAHIDVRGVSDPNHNGRSRINRWGASAIPAVEVGTRRVASCVTLVAFAHGAL